MPPITNQPCEQASNQSTHRLTYSINTNQASNQSSKISCQATDLGMTSLVYTPHFVGGCTSRCSSLITNQSISQSSNHQSVNQSISHPTNRVCAIQHVLMGWKTNKHYFEAYELPDPRPTQPKKKMLKVTFGTLFPTANIFSWVGIDFM